MSKQLIPIKSNLSFFMVFLIFFPLFSFFLLLSNFLFHRFLLFPVFLPNHSSCVSSHPCLLLSQSLTTFSFSLLTFLHLFFLSHLPLYRTEDSGLLTHKDTLPVRSLVLGDIQRPGSEAAYRVGPLRCHGDSKSP